MKQLLITIILLSTVQILEAQSKFEIGLTSGIGYDFQTRSNDFNLTGPLYIMANGDNSILHIEKPYQFTLKTVYNFNDNFGLVLHVGTSNRALRYWSLDGRVEPYSFRNDKINLGIRSFYVDPGIKLGSKLSDKLGIFWHQTFGIGFGKSSPFSSLTKDHPQAELIYLQNQEVGVLVNVNLESPIISINSNFGLEYELFKNTFLSVSLKYINEISNGNDLILWQYDLSEDRRVGGYTPYDLEFKTILTEIGITYKM